MNEALHRAALQRAVHLSAQVEHQLTGLGPPGSPLLALLAIAREEAASAIVCLSDLNADDLAALRANQIPIRCFDRIVEWLKKIVADGFDAEGQLDAIEREDLADLVFSEGDPDSELPQRED